MRDGIRLFKFYLVIGREMQLQRFHERRHDPFKRWKITDVDLAAIDKWDDYSRAQSRNLQAHEHRRYRRGSSCAPTISAVRVSRPSAGCLSHSDYADKDARAVGTPDPKIIGTGPEYFQTE